MKHIIYEIIDNCFNLNKNNINENNSANSDSTITQPQSIKGGSNNNNTNILPQKDIKKENKKIFFNVFKNININIINNNENNNINNLNINNNNYNNNKTLFISKKRKRIFSIQKIKKSNDSTKKIFKKICIFKQNFQLPKFQSEKHDDNIVIDIIIDKNKNNNNLKKLNNNIKNNNNNINNITYNNCNDNNNNNCIKTNNNNSNNTYINNNKRKDENEEKTDKELNSKKKKKKSRAVNEKELQIMYEQKFLENINKEYPDSEYDNNMKECLNDKKMKFMKDNFPMMFQKEKFYLYTILPKKKKESKEYYIEQNYFNLRTNENLYNYNDILYVDYEIYFKDSNENNKFFLNEDNNSIIGNIDTDIPLNNRIDFINVKNSSSFEKNKKINKNYKYIKNNKENNKIKIFNIVKTKKIYRSKINFNSEKNKNKLNEIINNKLNNKTDLIIKEKYSYLPKKVWSLNDNKINIEKFFDDCIQIWPFDECCFVKEIALEYLMKNNYSTNICLEKIKEFIYYMKKRAGELDFPIISESVKTIKKYNLRKTNYN